MGMLLDKFKKAVSRLRRPEEPERIVTDGFHNETFGDSITHFAQASRRDGGQYFVTYSEKYSVSYHHKPGSRALTLQKALRELHHWQADQQEKGRMPATNADLGFEAENYRDVARQFGIDLGDGRRSVRNANRIKRFAVGIRRGRL